MAIVTYMLCFSTKCSTTYDSITLTTFPVTKEMFYNLEWRAFAETLFQQCDQIWQNFKVFGKISELLFRIWQNFVPTLVNLLWYWGNFHCCKWTKLSEPSGYTASKSSALLGTLKRCERELYFFKSSHLPGFLFLKTMMTLQVETVPTWYLKLQSEISALNGNKNSTFWWRHENAFDDVTKTSLLPSQNDFDDFKAAWWRSPRSWLGSLNIGDPNKSY